MKLDISYCGGEVGIYIQMQCYSFFGMYLNKDCLTALHIIEKQ